MTQQLAQQTTNTFVRGLITEAGELTFPENASVDEVNCDLLRNGARRRRLGFNYEASNTVSSFTVNPTDVVSTHTWENVGNESGVEFLVVQIANMLYFYSKSGTTLSSNKVNTTKTGSTTYSVDLDDYIKPKSIGTGREEISVASINGVLVVVSNQINPFYIERDIDTGAFTETLIDFKVRDFEWKGNTANYFEDATANPPSIGRQYDTLNAGWVGTNGTSNLNAWIASEGAYPPLTLPWFSAKDSNGNFSVGGFRNIHTGTSLIPNGHYILDLWKKDRASASGITGVSSSIEDGRFSAVASYSGRVFYSGISESTANNSSRVFFSPILEQGFDNIGSCYQVNDPTSEVIPDLLDTDGGVINIPEAYNIQKLHVFGPVLYVFAENGVWALSGVDDVFRATEFSVSKLTETGMINAKSFVSAAGRPYWWSNIGIHTMVVGESNSIQAENLTISTIQNFWDQIDKTAKADVVGIYDELNSRVIWAYPDATESVETKFNNFLLFDETLRAFFPWTVADAADNSYIAGMSFYDGVGVADIEFEVIDGSGNTVVDGSGNTVVVTRSGRDYASTAVKFLTVDGTTGGLSFGEFSDTSFYDWTNVNYDSYAESGYNFFGDLTVKKNAPYLTTYFRLTETGWTDNGDGTYSPIQDSSCLISFYWDFSVTPSSKPQQGYLKTVVPTVNVADLTNYDYPRTTVTSRLRLRGRGQSMRIRFESEEGKDFYLLGFEVIAARNPRF